jgi:23S rRNA pseudouridine2605 synthase
MTADQGLRLQKIMTDLGICSRREAEKLIIEGQVTVNGKLAQVGDKAILGKDHIKVRGKLLQGAPKKVVIAFYKPRSILCSKLGQKDLETPVNSMWFYLKKVKEKVMPIGKLDNDAEGMVLLTNDHELLHKIEGSRFDVPRTYHLKIDGHLEQKKINRLLKGVPLEGNRIKMLEVEQSKGRSEDKQWVRVVVTHPQNRIVRKLMEAVGHPVDKVKRSGIGPISLRGLDRGSWRYLDQDEVRALKTLVGLK